jgi:hypothetical protein
MRMPKQSLRSALCASAILLVGVLDVSAAFAEDASSGAHGGDSKGSSAPAEASGDKAPSKGARGDGAEGETHRSRGDNGKNQQGGWAERGGPTKDGWPSVQTGKDSSNVDVPVEPLRRLDKAKDKPAEINPIQRKQGPSRRLSPAPQAPNPVRNAIGVIVPPPADAEPHDTAHPQPAVPHPPSAATPAVPNATVRLAKPDVTSHPAPNPMIAPPIANRGAINGTSVTQHNQGPPRIGGPAASAAGINGTTIRAKH